jgi:adenine-specific DNA methylase
MSFDDTMIDFENDGTIIDPHKAASQNKDKLYEVNLPYQGSKRGLIKEIANALEENGVKYESVLDLFSGSGIVSLYMKLSGKRVHSNDLLTSSYFNALVFVENGEITLAQAEIDFLRRNDNPNKTDFVKNRFGGKRFTQDEADFLDNYRANIDSLFPPSQPWQNRQQEIKRALCFVMMEHYVLSHCFLGGRLNSGQVLAKLDHRLNHDRNLTLAPGADTMTFNLKPPILFSGPTGRHLATNTDALVALKSLDGVPDLLYADPPYGGAQSDYATMFQFCEEYVYQAPLDQLPHLATSKKFVDSKGYEENFRAILDASKHIGAWAISYNDSSWADLRKLEGIVKDYKKNVVAVNITHRYKYRKDREKGGTEYLLIGK